MKSLPPLELERIRLSNFEWAVTNATGDFEPEYVQINIGGDLIVVDDKDCFRIHGSLGTVSSSWRS